jgi:DNA-binding PadR family transcriptional regulator
MFDRHRFLWKTWGESIFQKGNLKYIILDLIKDKPRYGYEIIRILEERSHGFYTPSAGVIYPTLKMLEESGYTSVTEQDGRKVYTITEEGRKFLAERKDLAGELKNRMKHHWNLKNIGATGQTMREFSKLRRLMHHRLRNADLEKIQRIRKILSSAYQEIEIILENELTYKGSKDVK